MVLFCVRGSTQLPICDFAASDMEPSEEDNKCVLCEQEFGKEDKDCQGYTVLAVGHRLSNTKY